MAASSCACPHPRSQWLTSSCSRATSMSRSWTRSSAARSWSRRASSLASHSSCCCSRCASRDVWNPADLPRGMALTDMAPTDMVSSSLSRLRLSASSRCRRWISSSAASNRACSSVADRTTFCRVRHLICFAWLANTSVEADSAALYGLGEMAQMRVVTWLPPSESCRTRVSTELRKLTCSWDRQSWWITWPSTDRDWLMVAPSWAATPVAPVLESRSDPARSTRFSLDVISRPSRSFWCTTS
mmetsp:Transcript_2860/g.5048  ORF Transcript_2860/g.5048 Transcript_2860/m.5048 type:complete len:243 (+) Transcript_2860:4415-5143(+)